MARSGEHGRVVGAEAAVLHQAVLDVQGLASKVCKIDDDVDALSYPERGARHLDRFWQKVAVIRDQPEWHRSAVAVRDCSLPIGALQVGDEKLEETRGPNIQPAKTVAARLHLQEWLHHPIDLEGVPYQTVEREHIEGQHSVGIEVFVRKDHRNVVLREAG